MFTLGDLIFKVRVRRKYRNEIWICWSRSYPAEFKVRVIITWMDSIVHKRTTFVAHMCAVPQMLSEIFELFVIILSTQFYSFVSISITSAYFQIRKIQEVLFWVWMLVDWPLYFLFHVCTPPQWNVADEGLWWITFCVIRTMAKFIWALLDICCVL